MYLRVMPYAPLPVWSRRRAGDSWPYCATVRVRRPATAYNHPHGVVSCLYGKRVTVGPCATAMRRRGSAVVHTGNHHQDAITCQVAQQRMAAAQGLALSLCLRTPHSLHGHSSTLIQAWLLLHSILLHPPFAAVGSPDGGRTRWKGSSSLATPVLVDWGRAALLQRAV